MIQIHIDKPYWKRDTVDVYIYDSSPHKTTLFKMRTDGHLQSNVSVDPGGELPSEPTLILPIEVFKLLAEKALEDMPPSTATVQHLKDAIQVRDRLLSIVEKQ